MDESQKPEVIEDAVSGLYIEVEPSSARKYDPDEEDDAPRGAKAVDLASEGTESAKKAAKALDAGPVARADAGKPKGASNALLFHQWAGDKKD